jgi:hypothetical protein
MRLFAAAPYVGVAEIADEDVVLVGELACGTADEMVERARANKKEAFIEAI